MNIKEMDYEKFCNETGAIVDEVTELDISLEKIRCLVDDVSQDYFDQYDPNDKKDVPYIIYDFNRQRVRMDMLVDYLHTVEQKSELIYSALDTHYCILKERKGATV